MRQQYKIRPEVIDRAKDRMGCRTDEQLADQLELTLSTMSRARRGFSVNLGTAISILKAADVDSLRAGIAPLDSAA